MLEGTMAKFVVPGLSKVKLVLNNPLENDPPRFLLKEPSKPMSDASLRVTSRKTTLIKTCGLGRSRLERTSEIYLVVSGSATTIKLRLSGAIEKVASPTPLFGYWRRVLEREAVVPPPPGKPPKPPGNCA